MGKLANKKLLILGESGGVPAPNIEECLRGSGAEVAFSATECPG